MSIIHDALKKAENNTPPAATIPVKPVIDNHKKINLRPWIIPVIFILCISFFIHTLIFNKNSGTQLSSRKDTRHRSSSAKRSSAAPVVIKNYSQQAPKLEGIIFEEGAPLAIINGKMVKKGDDLGDFTIAEITPQKAVLINNKNELKELFL